MTEKVTSQIPWYLTTYRWGQTNLTEDDPVKCDLNFWREQWKKTKVQGVIINCGGIVAYYPAKYGLQYRAKFLDGKDFYREFSDAAREAGLKVIARMDINRASKEFYDKHPDWFCEDRQGKPVISQDRYFSCVNSGYYKEYIPSVLTEIIEKYHPDGFADNSWKGPGRETICYCDNCKRKFMEDRGLDLPREVSWDDPVYREWIRWSYECRLENWDLFNETTQKAGGPDCLWLGMLYGDPAATGSFGDLYELCKRSRIIFSDHQSRSSLNGFEQNSVSGSLMHMASDENTIVTESMANYVRGERTFRLASNPQEETRLWMIDGIAGGISPWFHHIGGSLDDRRRFETPVPIFNWHSQNEDYLYNRSDLAGIGLIWSQTNADFYGRDDVKQKVAFPWRGFCHALAKARIPFLPINVSDVGRYSHRLSVLVLADMAILSDQQIDEVCDFIKCGGNLIMTGRTATLDRDGLPSGNDKLWKLLGLKFTNQKTGEFGKNSTSWEHFSTHSYFRLPSSKRHEVLAGFENTDILPFGGGLHIVESTGKLKPLASYIPAFPIYPPEFSWIREDRTEIKPIFAGELETGSRIVYFAADIDRCYGRSLLPDHAKLLANAVSWVSDRTLPLKVEGPGFIDCKIYKQNGKIIVHLVNLSGANIQGYCDEYLPVGPVRVTVDTLGTGISVALLTVLGMEVPVHVSNGKAAIILDRIVDHEMIVFM